MGLFLSLSLSAKTIYVNLNAVGGLNNGSSWADAFTNLNEALPTAQYGDEIWVAKGSYFPHPAAPILSFVLVSGTKLLGGFNGTESSAGQRDWAANETVLYGDEPGFTWLNVVYCEGTDSTTLLDGFTIRGGRADITVLGLDCTMPNGTDCAGGGLYLYNNQPDTPTVLTVQNCRFLNNGALQGGAIAANFSTGSGGLIVKKCYFKDNSCNDVGGCVFIHTNQHPQHKIQIDSCLFEYNLGNTSSCVSVHNTNHTLDLSITNSVFQFNKSYYSCAGVYIGNGSYAKPVVENCTFFKNEAGWTNQFLPSSGGALFGVNYKIVACTFSENKSNTGGAVAIGNGEILNCSFVNNWAKNDGGALWITNRNYIANCTFVNNRAGKTGGAIYNIGSTQDTILNCIFVGNRAAESGNWMSSNFGNNFVDHSLIDVADCEALSDGLHPMYDTLTCGPNMIFNVDPLFRDTAGGDFRLRGCSPLLNAGDSTWAAKFGLFTDLAGTSRWQDGIPDIGAYETPRFHTSADWADATCFGLANGSATLWAAGGFPPYSFHWDGFPFDSIRTDLMAGIHTAIVRDFDLCADTFSIEIAQPDPILLTTTVMHSSNYQSFDGSIALDSVWSGISPFTFDWSTGSTENSIGGLGPGTYTLTVTDAQGCTETREFEIISTSSTVPVQTLGVLYLYPNPAADWVRVTLPELEDSERRLELMDASGRLLRTLPLKETQNTLLIQWNNAIPPGNYTLALRQHGQVTHVGRVLKQ